MPESYCDYNNPIDINCNNIYLKNLGNKNFDNYKTTGCYIGYP